MTLPSGNKAALVYASRRRAALRAASAAGKVEAFFVSLAEDVSYLTGFSGEDSSVLLGKGWATLITDHRYAEQARKECRDLEVHVRTAPMAKAVAQVISGRGVRHLAVQADHMTLQERDGLAAAVGRRELRAISGVPAGLRAVKDASEIRLIRKAVRIAERAFRELIAGGAKALVGRPEREVAAELDYRMRLLGASGPAFETIVAAGAHGSCPHYRPGATRIRRDQPVLIDWGAKAGGYCSDLTRTLFIGKIPLKLAEVYEVVLRAQRAGIAAIAPGIVCRSAHEAARKLIAKAGYEEQFLHGLGHGIGRMVHEMPAMGRQTPQRLRKGMVVTVEPGIYLPGVGGVRIEDDVLVTHLGARRLSSLPRGISAMRLR